MIARLTMIAPLACLWVALAALASLIAREFGAKGLKRYAGTFTVLFVALLALPAAGVVKLLLPYKQKILELTTKETSEPILFTGTCSMFPADHIWNARVDGLPVDAHSSAYIQIMGPDRPLHADFGRAGGIPYTVVDARVPTADVAFTDGAPQSDPGPYHIPDNARVENGSDTHLLAIDPDACKLYELFAASRTGPGTWMASSGAVYDLRSYGLRPYGWTSADAAGLPILPGLVRYDEVAAGRIAHALRFTTRATRAAFVWPARHLASSNNDPNLPAMGQRFRLRKSFDMDGVAPEARVILQALQEYGMMLSDNGGPWFLTGTPDSRWSRRVREDLAKVHGSDFEAVDVSRLMVDAGSGRVR